ncbi:hypothetical protein CRE_19129 [Caenorhabditis remanei]|uniref:JmjC domain-containing protein n=1 Tax=Caenorhabditis remanei TaxID=31234 RepID=E3MJG7_CAERE|nr:hypothetical protein CRE_19129 [Caenorhabditis remanei]
MTAEKTQKILNVIESSDQNPRNETYLTGSSPLGYISVAPTAILDSRGHTKKRSQRSSSGRMGQPDAKRGKVLETRHALLWYHAKCLKDAVERKECVTVEQKNIIAASYEEYEEFGCSSLIGKADQDYQEMKKILMRLTQASTKRSQEDVEVPNVEEEGREEQPNDGEQPGEESFHELEEEEDKEESGEKEDTEELPSRKPSQKRRNKKRNNYYARFPPITLFTTPLIDQDLVNASGEQVVELASEWKKTRKNKVYESDVKVVQDIYNEFNTQFAESKGFDVKYGEEEGYAADMTFFEIKSEQDLMALRNEILESSACLIRGIPEALKMDLDKFSCEALEKIAGNQKVEILLQTPQSSTENVEMKYGKSLGWRTSSSQIIPKITYSEFLKSYKEQKKIYDVAVDAIINNPENKDQLIHNYIADKLESQYKYDRKEVTFPVAPFATNIDLNNADNCAEQIVEINKLVEFLRPKEGMMKLVKDKILGVNEVQCYVKSPGSRTPAHQENQLVASVNLNMGPGECVWICVSMAYAAKLEKLMNKKKISPYHTKYWPTEQDLIDAGIPYQKLIQKAGDLIYVGVGTYHWVQANGYCVNAAWNVAEMSPVQLAAVAYSHDNNLELQYGTLLPIYDVLLEIAQQEGHPELKSLAKRLLIRPLARAIWEWDYCEEVLEKCPEPVPSEFVTDENRCWRKKCRRNQLQNIFCVQSEAKVGLRERLRSLLQKDKRRSPGDFRQLPIDFWFRSAMQLSSSFLSQPSIFQSNVPFLSRQCFPSNSNVPSQNVFQMFHSQRILPKSSASVNLYVLLTCSPTRSSN